jgi:DnaJ-class molecular chaperone
MGCMMCNGTGVAFGETCDACLGVGKYDDIDTRIPFECLTQITCVPCLGNAWVYCECHGKCSQTQGSEATKGKKTEEQSRGVKRKASKEPT